MRPRAKTRAIRLSGMVAAIILHSIGLAEPAAAQSLLQQLFGWGDPKPQQTVVPAPSPRALSTQPMTQGGRAYSTPSFDIAAHGSRATGRDDDNAPDTGRKYRTVCVRLCDGYYYPINFAVTRKAFYQDGQRCTATCGGDARLFYLPSPAGSIADAVDLKGQSYTQLATAYKYRKTQVEGCRCRPEPWSESERDRHGRYAAAAQATAEQPVANAAPASAEVADLPPAAKRQSASEDGPPSTSGTLEADKKTSDAAVANKTAARNTETAKVRSVSAAVNRAPSQPRPSLPTRPPAAAADGPSLSMGLGAGPKLLWPGDAPAVVRR